MLIYTSDALPSPSRVIFKLKLLPSSTLKFVELFDESVYSNSSKTLSFINAIPLESGVSVVSEL